MTRSFFLTPPWLCVFTAFLMMVGFLKAEVSFLPPKGYEEYLRPVLTPFEEVKKRPDAYAGKDEPGRLALMERVTRVEEDGSYLRAVHSIYQPYTQKGAEDLATDRSRFSSHMETVHVALARTILADGTVKPLAVNAAFIQKGERSSGSMYDDAQDLVVVFPDVKPGVWCELIVVYECTVPKVKGGYGEQIGWSPSWPISERRHVFDVPKLWESRIKTASLGSGCPEMKPMPTHEGRAAWEWRRRDMDRQSYEPVAAPSSQVGPATYMSTFSSWDEFAGWYQSLLTERNELDEDLKAKVDEWTSNAKTPREILEILYDHAANDVRYEGLEFGLSGLQPYSCSTVWKNQYGDCKDKANLLVAMLKHKGIPARLVLLNTEHAGSVFKEIPDYRHFDHAIAVVDLPAENGKTESIFCDATIQHGRPGFLSPSSGDREVLAIQDGKAQWLKTPEARGGTESYQFDMEMSAEGRLSGWMTLTSKGCYALSVADAYVGVDKDTARDRLRSLVSSYISGAEVIDYVVPPLQRSVDEIVLKVFFTGPARQMDHEGRLSIPFIFSPRLMNDYGEGKNRRTSYVQWIENLQVDAAIHLPKGWNPASVPQPIKLETAGGTLRASWTTENDVCKTSFASDVRKSVIPADSVAAAAQATRAMTSWIGVPLFLKSGIANAQAAAPEVVAADMELMPTGEGQLNLVNRLFPLDGSPEKRKAALQKVIQYFPNDPSTVFEANNELCYQLIYSGDYPKALAAYNELVRHRPEGVREEDFASALYFQALALKNTGKPDEAVEIWSRIATNEAISSYRRAWAATLAGGALIDKDPVPATAISFLKQGLEANEDSGDYALTLLIPAMVKAEEGEALVIYLATSTGLDGLKNGGADALTRMTEKLKTTPGENNPAVKILSILTKARDLATSETRKKMLADGSKLLADWLASGDAYALTRSSLNKVIFEKGKRYLDQKDPGETAAKVEEQLDALYGKNRDGWMRLAAAYFLKFEPSSGFSRNAWRFLWYAGNEDSNASNDTVLGRLFASNESGNSFFEALAKATDQLPTSDNYYSECQIVKAQWMRDQGRISESLKIYQDLKSAPFLNPDFRFGVSGGLGEIYELQNNWEEAIASYLEHADECRQFRSAAEDVMKAGLLQARIGKRDEAIKTWRLLSNVPISVYAESSLQLEINTVITLSKDEAATLEMWEKMDAWWEEQFIPYYNSLQQGSVGEPHLFLMDKGSELNTRCRNALASRKKPALAKDLAGIAFSARYLPCHLMSLNQMITIYMNPVWPPDPSKQGRMLCEAAAGLAIGPEAVLEYNIRLWAGISVDMNDCETAIGLLEDQSEDAPGRSGEHRERCTYIYAMAALKSGKRLDEALAKTDTQFKESVSMVGRGKWVCMRADLMVKAGKQAEAVAYLKTESQSQEIKNTPEDLTSVREKLEQLSKVSGSAPALTAAATKFLQKNKPRWYDHIGLKDLQDPRVGNVEKLLKTDLEGFEPPEQFRLRMLAALSADLPISLREEALADATLQAGKWKTTWKEALSVWSLVLDDETLSPAMRLPLLWKGATEAAMAGQPEILAILKAKRVFAAYSEDYSDDLYPLLEKCAKASSQGADALKINLLQMGQKELTAAQINLASLMYALLLDTGNVEGAAAVRASAKDWKFSADGIAASNDMRLQWMRMAAAGKDEILLDAAMRTAFFATLEAKAKHAPQDWRQRLDVTDMYDLSPAQAEGIRAAVMLSGFRKSATNPQQWFDDPSYWIGSKHDVDWDAVTTGIPLVASLKDDTMATIALASMVRPMRLSSGKTWESVDAVLNKHLPIGSKPSVDAELQLWRFYRSFRLGNDIQTAQLFTTSKRMGPLAALAQGELIEVLMVNEDIKGLESIIDQVDMKTFSSSYDLELYIEVLRMLGRDEELELGMEKATRALSTEMMKTWLDRSPRGIAHTCDLAIICQRKDLIPTEWKEDMLKASSDPTTLAFNKAYLSMLNDDWAGMIASIGKLQTTEEGNTDWHWLMGRALVGQGKKDLAKHHLEAVLKDGPSGVAHFRHAAKLLKEIRKNG